MSITLGKTSLSHLDGVAPDMVRVVKRAALLATPAQDFSVIQGLRTHEECCVNWGKGRTPEECVSHGVAASYAAPKAAKVTWLANPFASNHVMKADGFGHAVDLAPYPIDWNDLKRFREMAALMKSAAHQEGVAIVCGIDWKASPDPGHFELAK